MAGVARNQDIPFCLFYVFSVFQLSILRVQQRLGPGSSDKMSGNDYAGVSFVYLGSFDSYRLRAVSSHFSFVSQQEIGSTR